MEMQLLQLGRFYPPAQGTATEVGADPDPRGILGSP